jgi:hypothetical protein
LILGDHIGDLTRKIKVIANIAYLVMEVYAVNHTQIGEKVP